MPTCPSLWSFEGDWIVDKEIEEASGVVGSFTGTASFTRQGTSLLYEEVGQLTPPGGETSFEAQRRYIWREEKGWIAISFDDGRPFHSLPIGVADPETTFLCDPDRYHVTYDFSGWPKWSAIWDVEGPRKSYRMRVNYRRP